MQGDDDLRAEMSLTEAKKALAALEKKSSVFCATSAFLLDVNAVDIVDRLEGCSRWALCSCPCSLIASEHLTNGKSAESLALLGLMHERCSACRMCVARPAARALLGLLQER